MSIALRVICQRTARETHDDKPLNPSLEYADGHHTTVHGSSGEPALRLFSTFDLQLKARKIKWLALWFIVQMTNQFVKHGSLFS